MPSRKKRMQSAIAQPPNGNGTSPAKRRKTENAPPIPPDTQSALLLHEKKQPYVMTTDHNTPSIQHDWEVLVKVQAIGLNPIDWKAPDYGFGIPVLPYVAGREFSGIVVKVGNAASPRIQLGDKVTVPSTDYRDLRKAAYQEYSIASSFNSIRLPEQISVQPGSILGVAFVSAVLALGVCMGLDFESIEDGPDLLKVIRSLDPEKLPSDIREECLSGITKTERAQPGDFLVIWGGSSTCAHVAKQIARLAGLKVVSVVDSARHGLRLSSSETIRPDLVVDSHDPERAIDIIKASTGGRARFGLDTQGIDSAGYLLRSLAVPSCDSQVQSKTSQGPDDKLPSPPSTPLNNTDPNHRSHLVGLTGSPKTNIPEGIALHSVPIKLFHEIAEVGEALSSWCEHLLVKGLLVPPDVVGTVAGLHGINDGLDRMRKREIRGGRLVAVLDHN